MLALAPPIQQHTAIAFTQPSSASSSARSARSSSRRTPSYSIPTHLSSSSSFTVTAPTQAPASAHSDPLQSQRSAQPLLHSAHHPQPLQQHNRNGDDAHSSEASYSRVPADNDTPSLPQPDAEPSQIDIHAYDSQELLRLLASLLTQIATTNDNITGRDMQSPHAFQMHSSSVPSSPISEAHRPPIWRTLTTASKTALSSNMSLTFHARNVPTISLEAYLLRILRYCPASNEVFLSLLVYFDRMSRLAKEACGRPFVIDSYNIHRLVIAGVTVASKFFSDVFYTNSRYAKVGGLPQAELNQLELQFLLLNNFSLMISTEEMQRYAEQLIHFSRHNSQSTTSDPLPSPTPIPTSQLSPAGPSKLMSSVDNFREHIPVDVDHNSTDAHTSQTPQVGPRAMYRRSSSAYSTVSVSDASETGTEGDFEGSTDDETTIRPHHSSDSSETTSLRSASDTDSILTDDGDRGESVDSGAHTPSEAPRRDFRMMTP